MIKQFTRMGLGLALAAGLASAAAAGLADERAFLEENKTIEGVVTTSSGLQIRMLKEGSGRRPTAADTVKVHYVGTEIDGTTFDSSYKRGKPAEFPLGGVIPGWTEGLQLISEGGKAQLVIPAELAYGMPPASNHPLAGKTLIFDVELIEVK